MATAKRNKALPASVPPAGGGGEVVLDTLLGQIGAALAADRNLGGLAENQFWSAPEMSVLAIEGAAPVLTARIIVTIEYLERVRVIRDDGKIEAAEPTSASCSGAMTVLLGPVRQ